MAKKVREQAIALSSYLKSVNSEDISENQDVQRMFCWDNAAINELILTVLTGDYIPPIILGEEELGGGLTQEYIVDGIQRTTALNKFRHMNWKTTKSFENSVIKYQAKRRDQDGHIIKDENGSILWDNCEFDIKNKTFEQLPDELKKNFDDYQIRIVVHQNCTMQEISKLVRRYNRAANMKKDQKATTWIPTYARRIKNITNNEFYKECVTYSDANRKNGVYEQSVVSSVCAMFHLDCWKASSVDRSKYLEEKSNIIEFDTVKEYGNRIAKICKGDFKDIFVFKDIPVWFAVFHEFTKMGLSDEKFVHFLNALKNELHSKEINGTTYDLLYKEEHPSDKSVIMKKVDTYTALMKEFLHIFENSEKEESENPVKSRVSEDENSDESILSFVKKNVSENVMNDDIELYEDMVDDCVKIDSPVYVGCKAALVAIMAYACIKEQDINFEDWIKKYERDNASFSSNQRVNFTYMKKDFDQFLKTVQA